jgi:SAM-dependent methyltransferase
MKDNFSRRPDLYARFRPSYPDEMVAFLLAATPGRRRAWDCGTGSGQFASALAPHFGEVIATDISAAQLGRAIERPNVRYRTGAAEETDFPDGAFDLVVAAQAVHWFDFEPFYGEVRRVLAPDGRFAAAGYGRCRLGDGLDPLLEHFYADVVGPFWDPERRHIDEHYRTIPFPFREIPSPAFRLRAPWSLEEFLGYLRTWSAVSHYLAVRGADPVDALRAEIESRWPPGGVAEVEFPFFIRIGAVDDRADAAER